MEINDSVEIIAELAHEMNRTYCESIGDMSQVSWDDAPEWQRESALLGVMAIIDNPSMSPEESHESWMALKEEEGWVYGPTKNALHKTHPCMVPYEKLPLNQRIKDLLFTTTVKTMTRNLIIARLH